MVGVAVKAQGCQLSALFQESGAVTPNARVRPGKSSVASGSRAVYAANSLWTSVLRCCRVLRAGDGVASVASASCEQNGHCSRRLKRRSTDCFCCREVQRLVRVRDWLGQKWREYGSDCAGNERREGVARPPAIRLDYKMREAEDARAGRESTGCVVELESTKETHLIPRSARSLSCGGAQTTLFVARRKRPDQPITSQGGSATAKPSQHFGLLLFTAFSRL